MAIIKPSWRHWWREQPRPSLKRAGLSCDEAKAAMIFEATRRRLQTAPHTSAHSEAWQRFTRLAWNWQTESWADLHADQRPKLLDALCDPFFIPPRGYTVDPQDCPRDCPGHSIVLDPTTIHQMVLKPRGWWVVAVNVRTAHSLHYAFKLIERASARERRPAPRRFHLPGICRQLEAWDKTHKPQDFIRRIIL